MSKGLARIKIADKAPETIYVKAKTRAWLGRLAESGVKIESNFLECLGWALDDARRPLHLISAAAKQVMAKRSLAKIDKSVREALNLPEHRIGNLAEGLLDDNRELLKPLREIVAREAAALAQSRPPAASIFSNARKQLGRIFGLDKEAMDLCELVFINQKFKQVEGYFEDDLEIWRFDNRRYLAVMLGQSLNQTNRAWAEAATGGYIDLEYNCRLLKQLEILWDEKPATEVSHLFCRPLEGRTIPLDNFCLEREDLDHAADLLRQGGSQPVHILLYGPPGTGKTTFARTLAKTCSFKAWAVASRDDDDDRDRRASLMACLHLSSKQKNSFVLVDEAERLLDTGREFGRVTKDKAWLNEVLEKPGRRIVWISNQIDHIDQAVRRRFSFSLYFQNPGKKERLQIWQQIVNRQKVKNRLPAPQIEQLAGDFEAPAAVIEEAVAQAKALGKTRQDFAPTVKRVLRAYATLQRDGAKLAAPRKAVADFTPEGVCLEGSIQEFLARCRQVDSLMRGEKPAPAGVGTMLFYGPPGTGKTALARYVAKELKRECLVKRASDLRSCWVGETEKLIARAFETAENEGSVLVIDEADSFIYSRDIATHSWETTQVNEFLTALEECRSFCICTTNRRENLDSAAMRRFSHKVAFGYAKPAQILALYGKLLAPLAPGTLTAALEKELLAMDSLTPGDFHAVQARYGSALAGETAVEQAALVAALGREQSLKVDRRERHIGF